MTPQHDTQDRHALFEKAIEPFKSNMSWLGERTLLLTAHGSRAYGTSTPTSDLDLKGIAIAPRSYYLGFVNHFEQALSKEPYDLTIFDVQKFLKLAADANPNIIEILFTDPSDWYYINALGQKLVDHRNLLISKKARYTFGGYAVGQLQRIELHRRYLLHPPKAPPTREEFGLPGRTVIPKDQLMAAESLIKKRIEEWELDLEPVPPDVRIAVMGRIEKMLTDITAVASVEQIQWNAAARLSGLDTNFIDLLDRERGYRTKKKEWESYQTWQKERNPARAEMEARFGYDGKHAGHLVRLLRMCKEILEGKGVIVRRPDAAELLEIRNGKWTYEELIQWMKKQDEELDRLYKTSTLPREPNRKALDELCIELIEAMP